MPRTIEAKPLIIQAKKMRHCFTCARAESFKCRNEDPTSLEDMKVKCAAHPEVNVLVGHGTDCALYIPIRT